MVDVLAVMGRGTDGPPGHHVPDVAFFRAHERSPVSTLCFGPSGAILVTADVTGQSFHVFSMCSYGATPLPRAEELVSSVEVEHLYTLVRGVTVATVTGFAFAADERWVAATTTGGTSHVFAINPRGGAVDVRTHTRSTIHWRDTDGRCFLTS